MADGGNALTKTAAMKVSVWWLTTSAVAPAASNLPFCRRPRRAHDGDEKKHTTRTLAACKQTTGIG